MAAHASNFDVALATALSANPFSYEVLPLHASPNLPPQTTRVAHAAVLQTNGALITSCDIHDHLLGNLWNRISVQGQTMRYWLTQWLLRQSKSSFTSAALLPAAIGSVKPHLTLRSQLRRRVAFESHLPRSEIIGSGSSVLHRPSLRSLRLLCHKRTLRLCLHRAGGMCDVHCMRTLRDRELA
jgi:hypothetical protein